LKATLWIGGMLARRLSPHNLVDLAVAVWPLVWEQIPPGQRVTFLTETATNNLGTFIVGLNRQERGALLNALLPIIARELPLAEVDLLTAFASPGDSYAPQAFSEE